jgi:hypothetical protein
MTAVFSSLSAEERTLPAFRQSMTEDAVIKASLWMLSAAIAVCVLPGYALSQPGGLDIWRPNMDIPSNWQPGPGGTQPVLPSGPVFPNNQFGSQRQATPLGSSGPISIPDMPQLRDIPRYPTTPPGYYTQDRPPAWREFLKNNPYLVPVVVVIALGLALVIIALALGVVGGAVIFVAHIALGLILVLCHVLAAIAILLFNSSKRPGR